ncbi:SRPBCC domain-containing protein [Cohnella yongneupensis]|uniref:SRPBCC domain-containing protein n=1 Tax=Cohnella yongneupensis TaxID=425006 RepID=A0ABW0R2F7_9BACL
MTMGTSSNNSVNTEIGELDLIIDRIFNAPRELVWKAVTEPEHVSRWWAPYEYTIPVCKIDLRPGGLWHYCMRSAEGEEHWVRSDYREIVKPERLVYTSLFSDADAVPNDVIPEQLNTMKLFEQEDGKTKMIVQVHFDKAEDLKFTVEAGMAEGMTNAFLKLDLLLAEAQQ